MADVMRAGKLWTTAEMKLLRKHYPIGGAVLCQDYIPRSRGAIQNQAWKWCIPGPKYTERRAEPYEWDVQADARVRALYAGPRRWKGDVSRLAERLGVTPAAVTGRARRLGVVDGHFWEREKAA